VALATVVALTRSTLWWITQEADAARLPLDQHIETLSRYLVAALWGQTPYDAD
jgi:hypothetical protein